MKLLEQLQPHKTAESFFGQDRHFLFCRELQGCLASTVPQKVTLIALHDLPLVLASETSLAKIRPSSHERLGWRLEQWFAAMFRGVHGMATWRCNMEQPGCCCRTCTEHNLQQPWRCFYAPTFWPHVEVPLLYHQCLYDAHVREYTEPSEEKGEWEDLRSRFARSYRCNPHLELEPVSVL